MYQRREFTAPLGYRAGRDIGGPSRWGAHQKGPGKILESDVKRAGEVRNLRAKERRAGVSYPVWPLETGARKIQPSAS
jgi:hypothetical protein